jgi:hypothetical protein
MCNKFILLYSVDSLQLFNQHAELYIKLHWTSSSKVLQLNFSQYIENKGNNKMTELRTILQRESQNS